MEKEIINKIQDIVENYLANTEINNVALCENHNDYYMLGKWDLAQEINQILLENLSQEINRILLKNKI